jgi:hypothetical protein
VIRPDPIERTNRTVLTLHIGTGTVEETDRLAISTAEMLLPALRIA